MALVAEMKTLTPALIVLDATGGFETSSVAALAAAALPVAVVNPRQVRDFAKATGQLAKTDTLDANILAHFGEVIRPAVRPMKGAEYPGARGAHYPASPARGHGNHQQNRLPMALAQTRKDILQHITWLKKRLKDIDKQTTRSIKQSPLWLAKDRLLQSVPGIGQVTSSVLWPHSLSSES